MHKDINTQTQKKIVYLNVFQINYINFATILIKFFHNYYKKVFNFKNKLYDHIRNREYQKLTFTFAIKSIAIYKFNLTQFFIFERNIINDANIIFKITYIIITFTFAAKKFIIKKNESFSHQIKFLIL